MNTVLDPGDMVTATELDLFAENTRELYWQFGLIIGKMEKLIAAGQYDPEHGAALWIPWYQHAARRYLREFSPPDYDKYVFTPEVIEYLAVERAASEHEKISNGEYI